MKQGPPAEELPYGLRVFLGLLAGVPGVGIFWFLISALLAERLRGRAEDLVFVPIVLGVGAFLAVVSWKLVSQTTQRVAVFPGPVMAAAPWLFGGLCLGIFGAVLGKSDHAWVVPLLVLGYVGAW